MPTMTDPIRASLTTADIDAGIGGDCYRCPVALALLRAIGSDANDLLDRIEVVEMEWLMRIGIDSRYIIAPFRVTEFVWAFDGLERSADGRIVPPAIRDESLEPFDFQLPPLDDPEWQEQCQGCEYLFDRDDLDEEEGMCESCREKNAD